MTLETTLNEVFRKIGRNVILFQHLEHLLKYLVVRGSISGYASEFMSQAEKRSATISKKTMGQLIGQYIELSNPETRDVLEEPKTLKEEQFIRIKCGFGDSTYHNKKKEALAKLVADRNELIHHLLPQFDSNSIESCAQIGKKLDEQRDNIVRQIDDLKFEIGMMHESAKLLVSFLNSPAGKKELEKAEAFSRRTHLLGLLTDIAEQTARPDGWTPIEKAGQLIRQRVPKEIASLKEHFGYNSLKAFIISAKTFEVYEEPTQKDVRILYRKKPNSE